MIENDRKTVRATSVKIGKRTYFYDVKVNHLGDYYLVITESRRMPDGSFDKHKIFVYEEDFYKFTNEINATLDYMKSVKPEYFVEYIPKDDEED